VAGLLEGLLGAFAARTGVFQGSDGLGGDLNAFFLVILRLGRFGVLHSGLEHGLVFGTQVGAGRGVGVFDGLDVCSAQIIGGKNRRSQQGGAEEQSSEGGTLHVCLLITCGLGMAGI